MDKVFILSEITRTANENGGKAMGWKDSLKKLESKGIIGSYIGMIGAVR
jgi:hypothetical protein